MTGREGAEDVLRGLLDIADIEEVGAGHGVARKFRVSLSDGSLRFAKVFPAAFSSRKVDALGAIGRGRLSGYPVNRVRFVGNCGNSRFGVCISDWLDSSLCFADLYLSGSEGHLPTDMLREFGRRLRRMHAGSAVRYRSSEALISQMDIRQSRIVELGRPIPAELDERVRKAKAYLASHPRDEVSLLHGDVHPGNMFVADGKILLVDFEAAQYADRLFDMANLYVHLSYLGGPMELFDAVADGYNEASGGELDADIERFRHVAVLAELGMVESAARGKKPSWWY